MQNERRRPLVLMILDGFGYREETEANAIAQAKKPNWDRIWETSPHSLISGSGRCVGLPQGQMGNSEVGHLNMGAGRIVNQDLTRIDAAIEKGEFEENTILLNALQQSKSSQKALHILGLLSAGGVHSHERHFYALLEMAAKLKLQKVYIHAFLDGRDTPPRSAMQSLEALNALCKKLKCGQIVSLVGRYFAMDRDQRWDRIMLAYDLLTQGKTPYHAETAEEGLNLAYERGENDEFVKATSIHPAHEEPITINDGDTVIFMNFRADRSRQITQAFIDSSFDFFKQSKKPKLNAFICLAEYDARFPTAVAFPPESLHMILAECLSAAGLKQLRIAETEKYAHVTFFFNGGIESPYPGEDRILIPSPKVATYDLQPEMSAPALTDRLIQEIKSGTYDVIICNFANADMVGHTGNFEATVKAIESIDNCLGRIVTTLAEVGGEILITADHGNAELMFNAENNQPHTAHTSELVPFIYIGRKAQIATDKGKLSDISPTILYLLGLTQPKEMTGISLLKLESN